MVLAHDSRRFDVGVSLTPGRPVVPDTLTVRSAIRPLLVGETHRNRSVPVPSSLVTYVVT